jgi:Helix-turn-helix domain
MTGKLYRDVEVSNARNIPTSTLRNLRSQGGGPVYHKIGGAVRYTLEDVDAWLDTTKVSSTSQVPARALADQAAEPAKGADR